MSNNFSDDRLVNQITLEEADMYSNVLAVVLGFNDKELINSAPSCYSYSFSNSRSLYFFSKVKEDLFRLEVVLDNKTDFCLTFSDIEELERELTDKFNIGGTSVDEEEIVIEDDNTEMSLASIKESIVPDYVSEVSLVGLLLDGVVVAYRFKTDVGKFDITKKAAMKYGISGFKVSKAIKLQQCNGLLLTQSEINNKQCIPDISDCEEDCKKLFNLLFS